MIKNHTSLLERNRLQEKKIRENEKRTIGIFGKLFRLYFIKERKRDIVSSGIHHLSIFFFFPFYNSGCLDLLPQT